MSDKSTDDLFFKLKKDLLNIDPVSFVENYLTLDGKPFKLNGNGYKPFVDIYRYVGLKALEPTSKPTILVKSRQTGGSTAAGALSMYFMGSGIFGTGDNASIRIMHVFPQLELAAAYSKTKLNPMITSSVTVEDDNKKSGTKPKSYMQSLLDTTSPTNDSLHFKQFKGGNHIWIESTGLTGDRLRGRTSDIIFFDECFPYEQNIQTEHGKMPIGQIYDTFIANQPLPKVVTFNEHTQELEYQQVIRAWKREPRQLYQLQCNDQSLKCTGNHRFLTLTGWKQVQEMVPGDVIKTNSPHANLVTVQQIIPLEEIAAVYDIEVEHNHNFIALLNDYEGLIAHNCQDTSGEAIGNSLKILTAAKYGKPGKGVQMFFGTPKRKGSDFHKMWQSSSQQYFYLGCEKCDRHFALYTAESDDWEKVWLHGFIVKCSHCGHEQDKRPAAERGKWIATKDINDPDCQMVGFHINQLYMPMFSKEDMLAEKPGTHPVNTERAYRNEVLGEFFQGDSSPITVEEIRDNCGETERRFRKIILPGEEQIVTLGIDYGARADLEQLANPNKVKQAGQSYSTGVVLTARGPNLLSIEFAVKFKRNDMESKKGIIDKMMRDYSVNLAIGDIGFSQDFSTMLHTSYGDKYLVSRAHNKINNHIKYNEESYPKEIIFERDHYIGELLELLKKGNVKFPLGDYEQIAWLIHHCSSMELKPSISRIGEPTVHYVKGSTPNDGFMALLNAYIAYKFILTSGFKNNNPLLQLHGGVVNQKPLVVGGYISRRMG